MKNLRSQNNPAYSFLQSGFSQIARHRKAADLSAFRKQQVGLSCEPSAWWERMLSFPTSELD